MKSSAFPVQPEPTCFGEITTLEDSYAQVLVSARRYAGSESNILIQGESGTGKELMARAIHEASPRRAAPYVVLNCAAISETLLHSELFGHVRGAFTGADSSRCGALVSADGGTLFLDEIGDAPEKVQVALLRALEEKRVKALGQEGEREVDVRIIAATSRAMTMSMVEAKFRVDLFFRLAGATVPLPPLRERLADLPLLARQILDRLHPADAEPLRLSPAALQCLRRHDWPGNVRELVNALTRAACLFSGDRSGGDQIEPEHLDLAQLGLNRESLAAASSHCEAPHVESPCTEMPSSEPRSETRLTRPVAQREEVTHHETESPAQTGLCVRCAQLLTEAQQYAASGWLLLPPGTSRRKTRARERALLLTLKGEGVELSRDLERRAKRLLSPSWQASDGGQALRDVQEVLNHKTSQE